MSFSTSSLNIKVRVSRFELYPKDVPHDYKVGFVVTHTRNKTSRYFEGMIPIANVDNNNNEEEIAVMAWDTIKTHVLTWYKNNKGIVGYTFEIPQEDFEKMIDLGIQSGLYTSNNLYKYLGIDLPCTSNSESNSESNIETRNLPQNMSYRQLY